MTHDRWRNFLRANHDRQRRRSISLAIENLKQMKNETLRNSVTKFCFDQIRAQFRLGLPFRHGLDRLRWHIVESSRPGNGPDEIFSIRNQTASSVRWVFTLGLFIYPRDKRPHRITLNDHKIHWFRLAYRLHDFIASFCWIAFVSHSPFTQFAENKFSAPNERTWIACKMRAPLVAAAAATAAEALIIYSDGVQICFVSLKCTQCNELASIQPQPFAVAGS